MNKLKGIKPYNDNKLVYNDITNEYELAFEFCKEEYPNNFVDDATLKARIKKNSRVVYRFINNRVNQYNKPTVFKILGRTEEGRNFIFDLLRTQFESDVETGYNDLSGVPAINTSNGQIIPREEILRNIVSIATEQVWDDSSTYFGINIGYQGRFPSYYYLYVRGL